jgi:hypothetical protein
MFAGKLFRTESFARLDSYTHLSEKKLLLIRYHLRRFCHARIAFYCLYFFSRVHLLASLFFFSFSVNSHDRAFVQTSTLFKRRLGKKSMSEHAFSILDSHGGARRRRFLLFERRKMKLYRPKLFVFQATGTGKIFRLR